jgi:hypothetical protein
MASTATIVAAIVFCALWMLVMGAAFYAQWKMMQYHRKLLDVVPWYLEIAKPTTKQPENK